MPSCYTSHDMLCSWQWKFNLCYAYVSFKFIKIKFQKKLWYAYMIVSMRYVWYAMIHGIFMFMHLMLFTKRITYVIENFSGSQFRGALEKNYKEEVSFVVQGPYDVL